MTNEEIVSKNVSPKKRRLASKQVDECPANGS